MADASNKILEGVFAISKPPELSSAQVLRELQLKFRESQLFAPLLERSIQEKTWDRRYGGRSKRGDPDSPFKMGHGGTLDPMATGVLIVGLGRGTKHLSHFIGSTKTYETDVLFGKSSDTYDVAGKVVTAAPADHITKELVEQNLNRFRGQIKQVPPMYSALRIQGMKAYEYARLGKELPRQLESRDMTVDECVLLEWYPVGEHNFRWPAEEASEEDKSLALKLIAGTEATNKQLSGEQATPSQTEDTDAPILTEPLVQPPVPVQKSNQNPPLDANPDTDIPTNTTTNPSSNPLSPQHPSPKIEQSPNDLLKLQLSPRLNTRRTAFRELNKLDPDTKAALHIHALPEQETSTADAPAAKIRLTVSSGFYVRSFAHDLGIACSSYAMMSTLIRTRQHGFSTETPTPEGCISVLTFDDLNAGEEVWGPKVEMVLDKWMDEHPEEQVDGEDGEEGLARSERQKNRVRDVKFGKGNRWLYDRKGNNRKVTGGGGGYQNHGKRKRDEQP